MSAESQPIMSPPIKPQDESWVELYHEMILRHSQMPADWAVATMAVRLYAKRVGFSRMLAQLLKHGVAPVAERCRHEMTVRQEFLSRMLSVYPPENADDTEATIQELAEELAIADSPQGIMRMLRYLDRILTREKALRTGSKETH